MPPITIVAHITAQADQRERVRRELEKLIAPTRAERGCLQYDFHQDDENPAHFMFYENWQSRELWQEHMQSRHLKAYQAATEGAIADFSLYEMTRLDPTVSSEGGVA